MTRITDTLGDLQPESSCGCSSHHLQEYTATAPLQVAQLVYAVANAYI